MSTHTARKITLADYAAWKKEDAQVPLAQSQVFKNKPAHINTPPPEPANVQEVNLNEAITAPPAISSMNIAKPASPPHTPSPPAPPASPSNDRVPTPERAHRSRLRSPTPSTRGRTRSRSPSEQPRPIRERTPPFQHSRSPPPSDVSTPLSTPSTHPHDALPQQPTYHIFKPWYQTWPCPILHPSLPFSFGQAEGKVCMERVSRITWLKARIEREEAGFAADHDVVLGLVGPTGRLGGWVRELEGRFRGGGDENDKEGGDGDVEEVAPTIVRKGRGKSEKVVTFEGYLKAARKKNVPVKKDVAKVRELNPSTKRAREDGLGFGAGDGDEDERPVKKARKTKGKAKGEMDGFVDDDGVEEVKHGKRRVGARGKAAGAFVMK